MIVKVDVPQLPDSINGFPGYWARIMLRGPYSDHYPINAIIGNYVKLVTGAFVYYREARRLLIEVWGTNDHLPVSKHSLVSTYFEDCVTAMHRASQCMEKLRSDKKVPRNFKAIFSRKPQFMAQAVMDRLRNMRNSIQHMEDKVLKFDISEGMPFILMATGDEVEILDSDQPGQTLMVINRLCIGGQEIFLDELSSWLIEMGECAEAIARFDSTA